MSWRLVTVFWVVVGVSWLILMPSTIHAQWIIDGNPYFPPNVTIPSGDLDVPYQSPTPDVTPKPPTPTATPTLPSTPTPPPAFIPASGSTSNPTTIAPTSTVGTGKGASIAPTPSIGNFNPTSVLNRLQVPYIADEPSPPQNEASSTAYLKTQDLVQLPSMIVGSVRGAFVKGEKYIFDSLSYYGLVADTRIIQSIIRPAIVIYSLGLFSTLGSIVWLWIKNRG